MIIEYNWEKMSLWQINRVMLSLTHGFYKEGFFLPGSISFLSFFLDVHLLYTVYGIVDFVLQYKQLKNGINVIW